jgi:hypothetical protein
MRPFPFDKASPSAQECDANGEGHVGHWSTSMNKVAVLPSVRTVAYDGLRSKSSTVKAWIYLVLISICCVFVFRKAPLGSSIWLDGFTYKSELTPHAPSEAIPTALFESNERTNQVQWDNYSLILRGQRIFLQ